MAAWGFAYKSAHVWGKDRLGTGYWARANAELLLIGAKGRPAAPAWRNNCGSTRYLCPRKRRGKHSGKHRDMCSGAAVGRARPDATPALRLSAVFWWALICGSGGLFLLVLVFLFARYFLHLP